MMYGQKNINLYMFRATTGPSAGEASVFLRQLVRVILKQVGVVAE